MAMAAIKRFACVRATVLNSSSMFFGAIANDLQSMSTPFGSDVGAAASMFARWRSTLE